jgi:hypothetical protein
MKTIALWNWQTKSLIEEVRGCTVVGGDEEKLDVKDFGARPNITFSPDSDHFVVRWEQSARRYRCSDGHLIQNYDFGIHVHAIAFSAKGNFICLTHPDGAAIFDTATAERIREYEIACKPTNYQQACVKPFLIGNRFFGRW